MSEGVRSVRFVEREQPSADDLAAAAALRSGRGILADLGQVRLAELSAAGRVDALVAWDKVIRWATANRDRVLAAMWAGQQGPARDKEWAREDVATALRVSPNYAMALLHTATELTTRLPETLQLLEDGEVTTYQARVIAEATAALDATAAAKVQSKALDKADLYAGQFRAAVQRAVIAADPAGAEQRRNRARAGRRVTIGAEPDGMGCLYAALTAENTLAVYRSIDNRAQSYLDDCRSADQKRADALVELVTGARSADQAAAGPSVQVTVALSTLLHLDAQPADLDRFGPVGAEVARLLAASDTARWRLLLTDQRGRLLDCGRTTYRPPAALRRFIQARDRTCRFPGCNRRADLCEVDHLERWEHGGETDAANLHALSGRHHHAKDDHGWTPIRFPSGTTEWRSPTGHYYQVPPATYPVDRTGTNGATPTATPTLRCSDLSRRRRPVFGCCAPGRGDWQFAGTGVRWCGALRVVWDHCPARDALASQAIRDRRGVARRRVSCARARRNRRSSRSRRVLPCPRSVCPPSHAPSSAKAAPAAPVAPARSRPSSTATAPTPATCRCRPASSRTPCATTVPTCC